MEYGVWWPGFIKSVSERKESVGLYNESTE
jgi:hypothetical protein